MKIAMIGQKGIPAESGGVEKHVEEISTRLVRYGCDVTVYCRSTYMNKDIDEYKGVKIKIIKTINNKNLDAIVYTYRAIKDALKNNFDIIHFHAIGPASLAFIPKLFHKKVVVTVHGLDWQRNKWGRLAKIYLKFGEKITGKKADKIISVSQNLRNYFLNKYKRSGKDIVFIPNGVNKVQLQEPNLISQYGLTKDNYILFLARLVPEKGAHYLIKAFKKINTNKKLVIAGGSSFTDDYVKSLKKIAEDNHNIIFTGNVSGNLLIELYSNCFIYVLPSDVEGMPLTLLEAMSYGKCCLVSDIPENMDVIDNNKYGFAFKKGNIHDLRKKIEFLLNDFDRNKIEKKVIRYIENNYDWDKITNDIYNLYMS